MSYFRLISFNRLKLEAYSELKLSKKCMFTEINIDINVLIRAISS